MKQTALKVVIGILVVFALSSCRTSQVTNIDRMSLSAPASASLSEVEDAIKRAGGRLGWRMKKIAPGHLEARLPIRKHLAVTDITFDTQTFSINYKDSSNLRYDPANNTIHSNYSGWVQNLQNEIVAEVSAI